MTPEQSSRSLPPDQNKIEEGDKGTQSNVDLYEVAELIYAAKVESLKEIGELRRAAEITSEEELDDHFDELARVYRQVCLELGLAWPPPPINDEEASQ